MDGATVHVSMVGYDNGSETHRELDNKVVAIIHPNLTTAINVTTAIRLPENQGISFMADTKGGAFDISNELAQEMLKSKSNPNGRSNREVLLRWVNGSDVVQKSRNMWIIDFGVDMTLEQASQYELPFEYIKKHVYPIRKTNKRESYRENGGYMLSHDLK